MAGIGLGLLSGVASKFMESEIVDHYNKKAHKRQMEFWSKQNSYNSPVQQKHRLLAAGLNPAQMYSGGAVDNTAGNLSSVPDDLPIGGDTLDLFGKRQQQILTQSQLDVNKSIENKNEADADKASAEAASLRGETGPAKADMDYKIAMTNLANSQNIGEGFKNEMLEFQRDIQEDVWNLNQEEQRSRIQLNNDKAKHYTQSAAYQALKVSNYPDELANLRASTEMMWQEAHIKEWQAYYAQEYYEALKDAARSDADSKKLLYEYENATQEQRIQMMINSFNMQEVQKVIIEKTKDARIKLEEAMANAADTKSWFTFFREYQALHESFARSIYALAKSYAIYKTGGRSEIIPDNTYTFEFGAPTDFD